MSIALISPSVQAIIGRVRNLLAQPDPTNSNWSDGELVDYINEAIRIYFAELTKINEGYFTSATTLNITSGSETIALPSDFFQMRAVYKLVSGTEYVALDYRNAFDENYTTQGGSGTSTYYPYYFFRGNTLVLRPTPQFSETAGLRIEYFAFPDTVLNGADSLTAGISPIFSQVVEMYAVYKAKLKESLVTGTVTYKIAEDNLGSLVKQFKEVSEFRSRSPTYIQAFDPEC